MDAPGRLVGRRRLPIEQSARLVLVEVYLLDWDGDLYDATLTVELDRRLRDERRFASVEALVEQMRADEADERRLMDG